MKEKIYIGVKHMFCPTCHREVKNPINMDMAKFGGTLKLNCGNCKKGTVILKGKKQDETDDLGHLKSSDSSDGLVSPSDT